VLVFLTASISHAQGLTTARPQRAPAGSTILDTARRVLAESSYTLEARVATQSIAAPARRRSKTRVALGAAAGAAGGFFAGGYLGAKIDGQCDCDDPGFKGALICAPIGAIVGGIAGGKWLF